MNQPTVPSDPALYSPFRLSNNCLGITWRTADGWCGCLRFTGKPDSNFVGTFKSVIDVRLLLRGEFIGAEISNLIAD